MIDDTTVSDLGETTALQVAALKTKLADAADTVSSTAHENIGLTLIGALVAGVAVGALLPFGRRRKKANKAARALAATVAATVTELTQTLAAQAMTTAGETRDKLGSASDTLGKSIQDQSENLGKQSKKLADEAGAQLNDTGKAIAKIVVKLVEKVRR